MPKMGIAKTFLLTTMNFFVGNVTLNLEQLVFLEGITIFITNLCRIGEIGQTHLLQGQTSKDLPVQLWHPTPKC